MQLYNVQNQNESVRFQLDSSKYIRLDQYKFKINCQIKKNLVE